MWLTLIAGGNNVIVEIFIEMPINFIAGNDQFIQEARVVIEKLIAAEKGGTAN